MEDLVVEIIEKYNRAMIQLMSTLMGLPDAPSSLIKSIVLLADPVTGFVGDITYQDLANILNVFPAPGRKNSGSPSKETIRSYLRSIEKQCPEHFKVISEGQKLQFLFPKLPAIFSRAFENTEESTVTSKEQSLSKSLENTDQSNALESIEDIEESTEQYTDEYISESAVKNNKIFNITNKNKQTQTGDNDFPNGKKIIAANFYPNQKTIEMALSMGLSKVTDPVQIKAFIQHNKKLNTQWADFNPVFLTWLKKEALYTQNKQQKAQEHLRSNHYERASPKVNSYDAALDEVLRCNQNACSPSSDELFPTSKIVATELEHPSRFVAVGGINQDLRPFISY